MNNASLLTFNAGSSTIKIGVFLIAHANALTQIASCVVDSHHSPQSIEIKANNTCNEYPLVLDNGSDAVPPADATEHFEKSLNNALAIIQQRLHIDAPIAIGHRIVHGGDHYAGPVVVDQAAYETLTQLTPLAPLHQPHGLRIIKALQKLLPNTTQTASFDTAFHQTQSELVRRFSLPRILYDKGIKRYGFHGLSYDYISQQLKVYYAQQQTPSDKQKTIVAHLGSGASVCAMSQGISQDTSMGFSTLDGLPMSTRCGALDPGVILYLLAHENKSINEVEHMLYHDSGLLGISNLSADSRELLESDSPDAKQAIDIFCFRIAREISALTNTLGGLDQLVFTAGIGEHQPLIREQVVKHLNWLGLKINNPENQTNSQLISAQESAVTIMVVPTNEEHVIAHNALQLYLSNQH